MSRITEELNQALTPFLDEANKYLEDHPEFARMERLTTALATSEGVQCPAMQAHFSCMNGLIMRFRLISTLALVNPAAFEAIYESFKPIVREIYPDVDFDHIEKLGPGNGFVL